MEPKTLDHVAFWLADREPVAEFLTTKLGMHVIDRQENFTLVGADARRGKLTLFSAEGPREPGAFKHVALRVSELPQKHEFDRWNVPFTERRAMGIEAMEIIVKAWTEGATLLFLFSLSNGLEQFANFRTRKSIESLLKVAPKHAC